MFACERELYITEPRTGGCVWQDLFEACARIRIAALQRITPALGFFLEALEIARRNVRVHETFLHHARSPLSSGRRKADRHFQNRPAGWDEFPCRGQEASQYALPE